MRTALCVLLTLFALTGCSAANAPAISTSTGSVQSATSSSSGHAATTGVSVGTSSGSSASSSASSGSGSSSGTTGHSATTAAAGSTTTATAATSTATGTTSGSVAGTTSGSTSGSSGGCGTCPTGYTCGSTFGNPVCRAPSGIPLFSHVFVILMENLSLSTLQGDGGYPLTPYIRSMAEINAVSLNYHGVAHPSLPNYIALTSGEDVSGIGCDCQPTGMACNAFSCNLLLNSCGCPQTTDCIGDDLEGTGLTWKNYAEDLGSPCNVTAAGNYAPKHVPFLYYPQVQTNAARCDARVVDFAASFASDLQSSAFPSFAFISPNLVNDMHDPPYPTNGPQNQVNGDTWLASQVPAILDSAAYKNGGILFVVWDEDDDSGVFAPDDPIGLFVVSPLAIQNGYQSSVNNDHYGLLATFEDGLGLPRVGQANGATPLTDFFPTN